MEEKVIYLGFKIDIIDITLVKEKIENIRTTKEPHNVSELKSFLGLINFYHRYFKNFSETLEPFHKLLRNGVQLEWGIIHDTNILVHYDPNKPL